MSASAPQVFQGITPDQYARLVDKAKAAGIEITGDNGTASKYGVEVTWNYDRANQQLTIQTLKTPFFMSADDVDGRIRNLVQESLV